MNYHDFLYYEVLGKNIFCQNKNNFNQLGENLNL